MTPIIVTSAGTACPVTPRLTRPRVERSIAEEWRKQAAEAARAYHAQPCAEGSVK